MPGRRRHLLVAVVSVVTLVAALTAARLFVLPWQRLAPLASATDSGVNASGVGERMTVFLGGFQARGRDPVHVRKVTITGVPRGLRIIAVRAQQGGPSGGVFDGNLPEKEPGKWDFQPVTRMVFHPGRTPRAYEAWNLVIEVEAVQSGEWRTTGIDITWKAGWRRGTTHYDNTVSMKVP